MTIEFRGKSVNGKWHYGLLSEVKQKYPHGGLDSGLYISNEAGLPFAYHVRPETVGQYTGVKDINNQKIYVGDIVKTSDYGNCYVMFQDGMFGVEIQKKIYTEGCTECEEQFVPLNDYDAFVKINEKLLTEEPIIEVVGNIYDDPKLVG